jgi:hypothetical protein
MTGMRLHAFTISLYQIWYIHVPPVVHQRTLNRVHIAKKQHLLAVYQFWYIHVPFTVHSCTTSGTPRTSRAVTCSIRKPSLDPAVASQQHHIATTLVVTTALPSFDRYREHHRYRHSSASQLTVDRNRSPHIRSRTGRNHLKRDDRNCPLINNNAHASQAPHCYQWSTD